MSSTETEATISTAWDRYAVAYQNAARLSTEVVGYGPGAGTETDYRLLGPMNGKRVLELGCGGGQSLIAMAKQGAIAIGVDISAEQLAYARRLAEEAEVRVELRHGDLAQLAFQRADTVDMVFSAMSLQYMPDLNRVFRQAHRVLKPQGTFVFSIPHPASYMDPRGSNPLGVQQLSLEPDSVSVTRSYFDKAPVEESVNDIEFVEYTHTVSEIFLGLVRTGYRVEVIVEPDINSTSVVPQILIVRGRKEA